MSSLIGIKIKLGFRLQTNQALFGLYLIWDNFIFCVDVLERIKDYAILMCTNKLTQVPFQSVVS